MFFFHTFVEIFLTNSPKFDELIRHFVMLGDESFFISNLVRNDPMFRQHRRATAAPSLSIAALGRRATVCPARAGFRNGGRVEAPCLNAKCARLALAKGSWAPPLRPRASSCTAAYHFRWAPLGPCSRRVFACSNTDVCK